MKMKLKKIPASKFEDYRYDVIFNAYKWDPQVDDQATIASDVLVIDQELADYLSNQAKQLSQETIQIEQALLNKQHLIKQLGLPRKMLKAFKQINTNYQQARLMRFDFHPTTDGWKISEVNSDVPGGLAEALFLAQQAQPYFNDVYVFGNIAHSLYNCFKDHNEGYIAFVYATSYSDDLQVMQFISDYFTNKGLNCIFIGPDHIKWINNQAYSILEEQEGLISGIIRFFPLEWLSALPSKQWQGYFKTTTISCNNPIALLSQSKRLPLIWDQLNINLPHWKTLLPSTIDVRLKKENDNYIYKPVLGRVGLNIGIKEAISPKNYKQIKLSSKLFPKYWIAQERFTSIPLINEEGIEYHLCIGVFSFNNECPGFYGRISKYPLMDSKAIDIPILVSKEL